MKYLAYEKQMVLRKNSDSLLSSKLRQSQRVFLFKRQLRQRLVIASYFELLITFIALIATAISWERSYFPPDIIPGFLGRLERFAFFGFQTPVGVAVNAYIFLSILSFIMYSRTPIAAFIGSRLVQVINTPLQIQRHSPPAGRRARLKKSLAPRPNLLQQIAPVSVHIALVQNIQRSKNELDKARNRPNSLLFIGGAVAVIGILFFIATVEPPKLAETLEASLLHLVPRLFMLVFIQVLAGFFLRQYRAAMEEFRYYEALLRQRESELVTYQIVEKLGDNAKLSAFADSVMEVKDFSLIGKDQISAIMEAYKASSNEFQHFPSHIIDVLRHVLPADANKEKTTEKPENNKGLP